MLKPLKFAINKPIFRSVLNVKRQLIYLIATTGVEKILLI
jgi:hypothetical protein